MHGARKEDLWVNMAIPAITVRIQPPWLGVLPSRGAGDSRQDVPRVQACL